MNNEQIAKLLFNLSEDDLIEIMMDIAVTSPQTIINIKDIAETVLEGLEDIQGEI